MKRRALLGAVLAAIPAAAFAIRPKLRVLLFRSYCAEANALFAAMTTPPTATRKVAINTLIVALKAAGAWVKCDHIFVLAAADAQASLLDWKNPSGTALVASNSPTFAADRGYTGNGTSTVLTYPVNFVSLTNYQQDNGHFSGWSRTAGQDAGYMIGSNTTNNNGIRVRNVANAGSFLINQSAGSGYSYSGDASGLWMADRTGPTTVALHHNGASAFTAADASTTRLTQKPQILATTTSFTGSEVAFSSIGASLAAESAAFYAAILAYMQAVGAA